jgi:hypothetical protein
LADLLASQSTIESAVAPGTNSKQALAWQRYLSYLQSIGIKDDSYLDNFDRQQKHRILGAFANAVRTNRFNSKKSSQNKSEFCKSTIKCVAQAYRMAGRPDPTLDSDGKFAFLLSRQFRSYANSDPPSKQQAAVTGSILRQFHKMATTKLETAMCDLFIGAFFFAMRSCEYLNVNGKRRTKILTTNNIRFFKGKKELSHLSPNLHTASTVSITFEYQKKDTKNDTITQHRSDDTLLCPVKIWAKIIKWIISYPNTKENPQVNIYFDNGKFYHIKGAMLLKQL